MRQILHTTVLCIVLFCNTYIYPEALPVQIYENFPSIELQKPHFLTASDSAQLAYYPFCSENNQTIVIFYPGPGLYGNKMYQWIGQQLQDQHDIGCYICDLRGHGNSTGIRGDTKSTKQIFIDVKDTINFVKQRHPQAKIYAAGHSTGAGLLINFAANMKHDDIDGFIFLTPHLGSTTKSLKQHKSSADGFIAKTHASAYSFGALFPTGFPAHQIAVYFDYSPELQAIDPLIVQNYTLAMSLATIPVDPKKILHKIEKPTVMFMAKNDDAFLTKKKKSFSQVMKAPVTINYVDDTSFAEMLRNAPDFIVQSMR